MHVQNTNFEQPEIMRLYELNANSFKYHWVQDEEESTN